LPAAKRDIGIQAKLCDCDVQLSVRMKDACQQTTLCQCPEFVDNVSDVMSSATASEDSGIDAAMTSSHLASSNSHEPLLSVNVIDEPSSAELKQAVDIDTVCTELEEFGLDDTVLYEYVCENLPPACASEVDGNAHGANVANAVVSGSDIDLPAASMSAPMSSPLTAIPVVGDAESVQELTDCGEPSPPDGAPSAERNILTSTVLGSPEALSDFFGLAGSSSVSDSELSIVCAGRPKSEAGKWRVSMCGEYDIGSPSDVFSPPPVTGTDVDETTAIADTDEEEYSPAQSSILYKTAIGELVSDSDGESTRDAVEAAVDDSVPHISTEVSADRSSFDRIAVQPSPASSEPLKPAGDGHCRDTVSEDGEDGKHSSEERGLIVEDGITGGHGGKNHAAVDKTR